MNTKPPYYEVVDKHAREDLDELKVHITEKLSSINEITGKNYVALKNASAQRFYLLLAVVLIMGAYFLGFDHRLRTKISETKPAPCVCKYKPYNMGARTGLIDALESTLDTYTVDWTCHAVPRPQNADTGLTGANAGKSKGPDRPKPGVKAR